MQYYTSSLQVVYKQANKVKTYKIVFKVKILKYVFSNRAWCSTCSNTETATVDQAVCSMFLPVATTTQN